MTHDIIGFVRVLLPRYSEVAQRQAMATHNITRVIQEGGKQALGSLDRLLPMVQTGTIIAVLHALLLASPRHDRRRGGSRAAFWAALDAIEERGGVIWELYTGLRTDKPAERDKMTRAAIDALARGRHKTRQSDKRGRPPKEFTEAQWEKAQAAWESSRLRTWADVQAKLPKGMTVRHCWNRFGRRTLISEET